MTLILLRSPLGPSQIRMVLAILKSSPGNRAILLDPSVIWPDEANNQILSITDSPTSPYSKISWDEVYFMINNASSLLVPANV